MISPWACRKARVARHGNPAVLAQLDQPDARVVKAPHHRHAVVAAAVVNDDQLEVRIGLRQHRGDRLAEQHHLVRLAIAQPPRNRDLKRVPAVVDAVLLEVGAEASGKEGHPLAFDLQIAATGQRVRKSTSGGTPTGRSAPRWLR